MTTATATMPAATGRRVAKTATKAVRAVPTLAKRRLQLSLQSPRAVLVPLAAPVLFALVIAPALANAVAPMAATRMTEDVAPPDLLDKLPAAHVAPVVGYLVSDECADTGTVVVAGGGQVHRVRLYQSKGVTFGEPPTIADVAERWSEITDMSGSAPGVNPVG